MAAAEDEQQITRIWAEALDTYYKRTDRDIRKESTFATICTTDDLLKKIEGKQQNFENFRHKQGKLWEVLRAAMKPVELLGGLAQDAVSLTPFAPASAVLGAVLFLVGVRGTHNRPPTL